MEKKITANKMSRKVTEDKKKREIKRKRERLRKKSLGDT